MIVVLSPAKKLDFSTEVPDATLATNPVFLDQTLVLVKELKSSKIQILQSSHSSRLKYCVSNLRSLEEEYLSSDKLQ